MAPCGPIDRPKLPTFTVLKEPPEPWGRTGSGGSAPPCAGTARQKFRPWSRELSALRFRLLHAYSKRFAKRDDNRVAEMKLFQFVHIARPHGEVIPPRSFERKAARRPFEAFNCGDDPDDAQATSGWGGPCRCFGHSFRDKDRVCLFVLGRFAQFRGDRDEVFSSDVVADFYLIETLYSFVDGEGGHLAQRILEREFAFFHVDGLDGCRDGDLDRVFDRHVPMTLFIMILGERRKPEGHN